jgi:hypothetical protein
MSRKRISDTRIFFPWESHGGMPRWIGFGRLRPIIAFTFLLIGILLIAGRESRQANARQTRAMLQETELAVQAYMADHDGGCPSSPQDVATHLKHQVLRRDAWGQLPRLICPSRQTGLGFEVVSDGPDRTQGGLDRIE